MLLKLKLKPPLPSEASMCVYIYIYIYILVLPLYCYQPISLHPHAHMLSHVTPWTAARQAPLSMDFSRQEYWSGLPFPSPKGSIYFFNLSKVAFTWPWKDISSIFLKFKQYAYIYIQGECRVSLTQPFNTLFLNNLFKMLGFVCYI